MKVGDLIWNDERGQCAILIGTVSADGDYPLCYLLFDDGEAGHEV